MKPITCWGLTWHSENELDGISRHFIREKRLPALFLIRSQTH